MMQVEINFQPQSPALQARHIDRLIDLFLTEHEARCDRGTVKHLRNRLRYFRKWWAGVGPAQSWCLDETALIAFARHLETVRTPSGKPLSWGGRHGALRRLRQMLRWAHRRGFVPVDFSHMVPDVKGAPPPQLPVTLTVLERMIQACDQTWEPERNRAILAILAGTGVRCEECAALLVENVIFQDDHTGLIRLTVAKNDKLRIVAFDAPTGQVIRAWVDRLPYAAGPVFPSRKGRNNGNVKPLTPDGLYRIVVRIAKLAGVRDEVRGPHDFRRLFATTWARAEAPADLLQTQMGHADFNTTKGYILSDTTTVRETLAQRPISPFAQIQAEQV